MSLPRIALVAAVALLLVAGAAPAARAQTEIQWWHAMGGQLGEKLNDIAAGFNKAQDEFKVVPVYKGNYTETMTGAIAAFRAKKHPHIVQVFEVGTATMMAAKGAIKPVYELMAQYGERFDPAIYLPAVTSYYTTPDGKMLSLPFNSSTPVLWYNKDIFRKAGLDPQKPPKTWPELVEHSKKIQAAGVPCGFTTGWQSWVQLENFSAWHNVPFATNENGFTAFDTNLLVNGPLHVRHIGNMAEWQKAKIFDYGGRRGDPNPKYYNGECAMLMNSSAYWGSVKKASEGKFEFGVGMLPYYPDVKGAPQNSIIGGATLWVLAGHAPVEYRGVANFFAYMSSPEVQADWHQSTGYLPITLAAYELTKRQGFYEKNPGADVAILQLTKSTPTPDSKGLRLGNFVQIRDVINEELEAVWAGEKTAKEALDTAVQRGNNLLRQFERTVR